MRPGTSTPPSARRPEAGLAATPRRRVPAIVRSVALLDLMLGLWAFAIAAGYAYLWFENYRMNIDGRKVSGDGVFFAILVNARWAGGLLGMDEVPGGGNSPIPGGPSILALRTYRMIYVFPGLAAGYLALGVFWVALADGLDRGLRWARRTQAALGWLGLAVVVGYATLYLFASRAPREGLLVVASAAVVPGSMVLAARRSVEAAGASTQASRAKVGLPGWSMIAAGLAVVALLVHLVQAWWTMLILKQVI
jgi:hypothetical protein